MQAPVEAVKKSECEIGGLADLATGFSAQPFYQALNPHVVRQKKSAMF
jgi:hypothetical protein